MTLASIGVGGVVILGGAALLVVLYVDNRRNFP